jgi:N-acetylneuraminic acid mutarotase
MERGSAFFRHLSWLSLSVALFLFHACSVVPANPSSNRVATSAGSGDGAGLFNLILNLIGGDYTSSDTGAFHALFSMPRGQLQVVELDDGRLFTCCGNPGTYGLYDRTTKLWSEVDARATGAAGLIIKLSDGRVLGLGGSNISASKVAHVFDPASETWSNAGTMIELRDYPSAILLGDGRVLVVGGLVGGVASDTCEIYDPATNSWSATGTMATERKVFSITTMQDGRIFAAGGRDIVNSHLDSAEIYDPALGTWSSAAPMPDALSAAPLFLLPSQEIAVVLGESVAGRRDSIHIYHPGTDTWRTSATLPSPRGSGFAQLLGDGTILIAGGEIDGGGGQGVYDKLSYSYDYVSNTFTPQGDMRERRASPASTVLSDGSVVALGSLVPFGESQSSLEFYNPASGTWSGTVGADFAREDFAYEELDDGRILLAGGMASDNNNGGGLARTDTVEVYDPDTDSWSTMPDMSSAREGLLSAKLADGRVLLMGGEAASHLSSTDFFDPSTNTLSAGPAMSSDHTEGSATLLNDGRVLVVGGLTDLGESSVAEIYDPLGNNWTLAGTRSVSSVHHVATKLSDGRVLITGGYNAVDAHLAEADIYDPVGDSWTSVAPMASARYFHSATLLGNGKVLVAGGSGADNAAEIYDPVANSWSAAGALTESHYHHTAKTLSDGRVVLLGGGSSVARIYDPDTNSWSDGPTYPLTRFGPMAVSIAPDLFMMFGGYDTGFTNVLRRQEYFSPVEPKPINLSAGTPGYSFHVVSGSGNAYEHPSASGSFLVYPQSLVDLIFYFSDSLDERTANTTLDVN